jgi:hypothetical protein
MNIRTKAALYTIGFFVGILALASVINAIAPYVEMWMISAFFIAILVYVVYTLMLAKLTFDEDFTKLGKGKE